MASPTSHAASDSHPVTIRESVPADREAIANLLHSTFVDELGQYQDDGSGHHVDKFDAKNTYFLAENDGKLVGAIAVHGSPPFSVAARLPEGASMAELSDHPLEVRLLCVAPGLRFSRIAFRLMAASYRYAVAHGYRELWISGVSEQLPLYRKLGFKELGPPVAAGDSFFSPMRVKTEGLPAGLRREAMTEKLQPVAPKLLNLLPGPARLRPEVQAAAAKDPIYHRSAEFLRLTQEVAEHLRDWQLPERIALLSGGGTLANDAVANALSRLPKASTNPGVILTSGEFGDRLAKHAHAAGLEFDLLRGAWGEAWPMEELRELLATRQPAWIWGVHLESSTGVLNPAAELLAMVDRQQVAVCLDCASSLGGVEIPIGAAMVSSVSGKSLEAIPGIAVIAADPFWVGEIRHHTSSSSSHCPPGLDLLEAWQASEPPHTLASQLLLPLAVSLRNACNPTQAPQRLQRQIEMGRHVREQLRKCGLRIVASEQDASSTLTTFEAPAGFTTIEFLERARAWGFQLAGQSRYLRRRRLAQIATLGDFSESDLSAFFGALRFLT
ncbi:MAG: aminotransferase class V-fold PLP-dependent enzyme [Planctomycetes bacterium]|nr:aminotransferase class V-fold PLP-dependent enzyme [Planctomycetota bacterium]MCP4771969.1 aminotransferase class V-fold PLP-dependent enzyme [Planctomycetota bacterium]MCP4860380.1 aminotransferase class V-fold PLP-dependent enzyme [Planctomycetota bacterium]